MAGLYLIIPLSIFAAGELVSNLVVFRYISSKFSKPKRQTMDDITMFGLPISIVKGILERAVLFIGLNL